MVVVVDVNEVFGVVFNKEFNNRQEVLKYLTWG
jgi:hypothetical protein